METRLRPPNDPGFRLIETCAWLPGQGVPRRDFHLARLQGAASRLGITLQEDPARFLDELPEVAPSRLRLTVDAAGHVARTFTAFDPTPPGRWRVGLATERLDETNPWRGVKSTERGIYDRARAALPEGLDEVVFANRAGFLADGTITNLFVDFGEGLVTPPLRDGALPGVLRASLLGTGQAKEARLTPADLSGAGQVFVGNSLRGLIPALWCG